jgi:cytosine/adenosine deaminase-related metal-dependent hydrolase
MRAALAADPVTPPEVLQMVTAAAARVLKLPDAGEIAVGQPADLLVIPGGRATAAESLVQTRRADVLLVTIGGRPMVAERRFCSVFRAHGAEARPITIDGTDHVAAASLARAIARCPIQEPGVSNCS